MFLKARLASATLVAPQDVRAIALLHSLSHRIPIESGQMKEHGQKTDNLRMPSLSYSLKMLIELVVPAGLEPALPT